MPSPGDGFLQEHLKRCLDGDPPDHDGKTMRSLTVSERLTISRRTLREPRSTVTQVSRSWRAGMSSFL